MLVANVAMLVDTPVYVTWHKAHLLVLWFSAVNSAAFLQLQDPFCLRPDSHVICS